MPKTFYYWKLAEMRQPFLYVLRLEVHPTHNTLNKRILFCCFNKKVCLFFCLFCLYSDRSMNQVLLKNFLQVCRLKIFSYALHRVIDPAILLRIIIPEMLMSINDHGNF